MALTFFWRCEAADFTATNGSLDYSAGDTTATAGGSETANVSISATAVRVGTNGVLCANDGSTYYEFSPTSIISAAAGAVGGSFKIVTWADGCGLFLFEGADPDDSIRVYLSGSAGSGNLSLNYQQNGGANVTVTTSGANLTTGQWYGFVGRWSDAQDDLRIEVYNSSGSLLGTAGENLSAGLDVPTGATAVRWGEYGGTPSIDFYLDNLFIADAYNEAIQSKFTIESYSQYAGTSIAPLAMTHFRRMRA